MAKKKSKATPKKVAKKKPVKRKAVAKKVTKKPVKKSTKKPVKKKEVEPDPIEEAIPEDDGVDLDEWANEDKDDDEDSPEEEMEEEPDVELPIPDTEAVEYEDRSKPSKKDKGKAAKTKATTEKKKKKKKKKKSRMSLPEVQNAMSNMLGSIVTSMRADTNDPYIMSELEADKMLIGIPIPFAFEFLLQMSNFPLSRMTQIVGTEGTFKSALTFEMARWFRLSGGTAVLHENESKYSPKYACSIVGWPKTKKESVLAHIPCYSVDDWQSKLQSTCSSFRDAMVTKSKENPKPPGRIAPVLLLLDSIMGKLTDESQAKIESEGSAGRQFAIEALSITNFLKKFPQDIYQWPFSLVAVNHLKPMKAEQGYHMERRKGGGRTISFQETFEIQLDKTSKKISLISEYKDSFEVKGHEIRMKCFKNSLGETQREIYVNICWEHRFDEEAGETRQFTWWDWDTALVKLLASYDKGTRKDRIWDIVDVHDAGKGLFWSNKMGIKGKKKAVPAIVLGKLIQADTKVIKALRSLFGIANCKRFLVGVDYLKQVNMLQKQVEAMLDDE
jgi:hypothetical protein